MSVADGTSVIPPGWYEDPADPARLRRWDGQQWTQEVLLAPEQAPAMQTPAPTAPPSLQPTYAEPPAPPQAEPDPPHFQSPPQPAPTVQAPAANVPPVGAPIPASPAPTSAPPVAPGSPATADADPIQPTIPRPSPPVNQHPNPPSGPVSLPEWANLPGLTLPPDLSSLPGVESNSILNAPTFEAAAPETPTLSRPTFEVPVFEVPVFEATPYEATEQRAAPREPLFEPPYIPQRPDVQQAGSARSAAIKQPPAEPQAPVAAPAPATPYAPPPAGPHYDVPPPPGMAHVPSTGPALPPSAFVAAQRPSSAFPQLPPVGASPAVTPAVTKPSLDSRPVVGFPAAAGSPTANLGTVSIWLIAALPLLQFAAVYVVFGLLHVTLAPGMQWGILAVPAAFSLLFANTDKKKLTELGAGSPSIVLGLVAPLYLIVRCVTTGRSSLLPLIAWVVLQAGAAAGVYFLLPKVLSAAIHAIG